LCRLTGTSGRGYELNGPVVVYAKLRALFSRGRKGIKVKLLWRDFFRSELQDVAVLYCYLMPGVMRRVGQKSLEEMQPGTHLISYMWEVPEWIPSRKILLGRGADPLYVYELPPSVRSKEAEDAGQKLDGPDG